jgi:hypothetical protein
MPLRPNEEHQMTVQPPARDRQLPHDPYGEGNSIAGWTAVSVVMLGALLMCVAVGIGFSATWLFIVGIVVVVIGPILGKVLGAMGFGPQHGSTR